MSGHVHVAGVGGVGMSALAQALVWSGFRVTGSDRLWDRGVEMPVWEGLRRAGVELAAQDGSGVGAETLAVVYSTAVEAGNPDFEAARRFGVPLRHRAAVLAELAEGKRVAAVAGTAGKTTTTGMAGWVLEQVGMDPTVVNGGGLVDWACGGLPGNARRGGTTWVLEVDESDRSLLRFRPAWSVLTNISQDHFSLDEVQALFREYAGLVTEGVVCGEGVAEVLRGATDAELVEVPTELEEGRGGVWRGRWRGRWIGVAQPGRHNAMNAVLAAELCARMGAEEGAVAEALGRFGGIQRRMERVDAGGGAVRVYDDYAHNPAKVWAAWAAARAASEGGRVLGVWRPHGFKPLRDMMEGFAETFAGTMAEGDVLWVLPVYYAGGTTTADVRSEDLTGRVCARGRRAVAAEGYAAVLEGLAREAREGDTVVVMGARDPGLSGLAREADRRLNGEARRKEHA